MIFYVTADTLQVNPLYVTLRNPINWLRGSRTCIDDDQPYIIGLRNHECGIYTGCTYGVSMYCFDNFVTVL